MLSIKPAKIAVLICLSLAVIGCAAPAAIPKTSSKKTTTSTKTSRKPVILDTIREEISTSYYDIEGTTKEELNQQMTELGPKNDGGSWAAWTDWAIDWDDPIDNGADVNPVQVSVRITYTLPHWIDRDQAPADLQAAWDTFQSKLRAHEEHHKDIAVKYAQMFLDEIKKIKDYRSASELEDRISDIHGQGMYVNGCTQEEAQYDIDTNHGIAEGVVL